MERKLLKNWLLLNNRICFYKQSRLWLALFFSLNFFITKAQINYVNNPSFEVFHTSCSLPNFTTKLKYWNSLDSVQTNVAGLTYNTCYSNVPLSGVTYQWPRTGNGFIRLQAYCSTVTCSYYNSRLYPKNRMKSNLINGQTYCVKMFVNLQNSSAYAIDALQILFSDVSIDTTKYSRMPLTYLTPQITNTLGIINDSLNWVEVKGTFVANGTEKYLIIGNFKTDAITSASSTPTGMGGGIFSEYMIDDVSVIEFNLAAYAGPDKNIFLGDSAFIGRPPEIGLECTWTTGTVTVGDSAGIWVKPSSPGTYSYVVTQNICGNIKTDTVNVVVSPSSINENIAFGQSINLYPQPAKDILNISLSNYYEPSIKMKLTDVEGREIENKELQVSNFKTSLSTQHLSNGVYILQLISKNQTAIKRLIISK